MSNADYDRIANDIETNDGVIVVEMWRLRDAHGADRLGVNVNAAISEELDHRGIGHLPPSLPLSQHEPARLYKKKSAVGRFISALAKFDEKSNQKLRSLANDDSEKIVQRIKEMICG